MAVKDIAGTPRKLTIDGIPFRVAADVNVKENLTKFENSMIATSGTAMRKMVKRIPSRESVVLITNASERDTLIAICEDYADHNLSYQNAAGDTYRCQGVVECEGNETEENRTTVQLLPRDGWTTFLG